MANTKTIVIRDAQLFTPQGRREGDLRIEQGRISALGAGMSAQGATEIDARGMWLWPGAIDAHVHLRDPGLEQKEDWASGSRAAAAGGVTCVFDMPNTHPSSVSVEAWRFKLERARARSIVNYGAFFGANPRNLDEILRVPRAECPGLKIFMASSTGDLLVDKEEDLDRIFSVYDGQICVHAESEERLIERAARWAGATDPATHSIVRDPEAARLGVELATKLANRYARRLHILHVSSAAEIGEIVKARRAKTARITAEACPHHLFLSTDDYAAWGARVQMNPPLRDPDDVEASWRALLEGVLDMVATDHAPHLPAEKERPYPGAPSGVPGVQLMLPLLVDAAQAGRCTPEQVVEWICHAPARIYGIEDRGRLEVGRKADLVLIDPERTLQVRDEDQHSRCGWTPYRGRTLRGWPARTFVNGQEVWRAAGEGARGTFVGSGAAEAARFVAR